MNNLPKKTKSNVIIFLLFATLSTAILYGLFAFVTWQLSPGDWSKDARFFFAMLESVIIPFSFVAGVFTEQD